MISCEQKNKIQEINDYKNRTELIDLHTHTCYSDGELLPNELLKLAVKIGINTIAITDHDTLLGLKNIKYGTYETDLLNIIPGIELSAKTDFGRMHILGYGIDKNNELLNKKMIDLKNNSIYSVLSLIYQIRKDYNIIFNTDDIQNLINSNSNIGRPHLANLCIKYGYACSVQEAFDKYLLKTYEKTKTTNKGITYQECIELILNAGGIPVLAHPKTLNRNDKELLILLKEMISFGLKGIEVFHSSHTEEETKQYLKLSENLNLLCSGGSDFHGENVKPNIELGTGKNNNLNIKKLTILNELNK